MSRSIRLQCGYDQCTDRRPSTKILKCSACCLEPYCSRDCQKLDWPRHKKECSPIPRILDNGEGPNSALVHAVQKQALYLVGIHAAIGEVATAARSALNIGQEGDLRSTHCLALRFTYRGPSSPTATASRTDAALLRNRFRYDGATVVPVSSFINSEGATVSGEAEYFRRKHQEISSDKGDPSKGLQYVIGVLFTIPGDEDRLTLCNPPFPAERYSAVFRLAEESKGTITFATLPSNPKWEEELGRAFNETVERDDILQVRFLKMGLYDCGVSKGEVETLTEDLEERFWQKNLEDESGVVEESDLE